MTKSADGWNKFPLSCHHMPWVESQGRADKRGLLVVLKHSKLPQSHFSSSHTFTSWHITISILYDYSYTAMAKRSSNSWKMAWSLMFVNGWPHQVVTWRSFLEGRFYLLFSSPPVLVQIFIHLFLHYFQLIVDSTFWESMLIMTICVIRFSEVHPHSSE